MHRSRLALSIVVLAAVFTTSCAQREPAPPIPPRPSYAIYGEYARVANKKMKNGLNRRVFNKVEAQAGNEIRLKEDGCIALAPGRYRLSGFSTVTMQTTLAPPTFPHNETYPGYCLLYPEQDESQDQSVMKAAFAFGSPSTAAYLAPSTFDAIHTFDAPTDICVGHQAGNQLNDEVYLSIYEVDGVPSDYHVVARIAITRF